MGKLLFVYVKTKMQMSRGQNEGFMHQLKQQTKILLRSVPSFAKSVNPDHIKCSLKTN